MNNKDTDDNFNANEKDKTSVRIIFTFDLIFSVVLSFAIAIAISRYNAHFSKNLHFIEMDSILGHIAIVSIFHGFRIKDTISENILNEIKFR